MDDEELVKPWKCGPQSSHVLGVVMRDGGGVRRLGLYRWAVESPTFDAPANAGLRSPSARSADGEGSKEVEVMALIEGYVADVRCSICGRVRTWVPGVEALRKMMKRV
jgi:hypothetical protein